MNQPTPQTSPTPEIARDRWGRPMIAPRPGEKPVPYTRATTIAKTLDDGNGLTLWKQRLTALGLATRHDLYMALAATDPDDKKGLDRIVAQAFDAAGGSARATVGTALHVLTERLDRGLPLGPVPQQYQPDLDAYQRLATEIGWEVLDVELFTVDHQLKIAGTADRVLRIDGRNYIADLKTGSSINFHHAWAVQFAIYAGSQPYDIATARTIPWPYSPPDRERALVIHMPAGEGTATAHWIDITAGSDALHHSMWVRRWRQRRDLLTAWTTGPQDPILAEIGRAKDAAHLNHIWARHQDSWQQHHTQAATIKKAALTGAA